MVDAVQLTKQASKFWNAMPVRERQQILANVYCVRCGGSVSIADASGTIKGGNLMLEGKCSKCGHEVARLVEGLDA
jgi:hypothetical protein